MEWISIDEKLPPEKGEYEVRTGLGVDKRAFWVRNFIGKWQWLISNQLDFVTHWKEIEPPKTS